MLYSCVSDVGLVRQKNQDSYIAIKNKYDDYLFIVADGIGGGKAGEVASGEIINYFNSNFEESGPFDSIDNAKDYLTYHLKKANRKVYDMSMSVDDCFGMGSTITGIFVTSFGVITFNCGDSRVYGISDNSIKQLTKDHTLVNQMIDNGEITYEESINHPKKHYLVKAIGIFKNISCDVNLSEDYKYYLICSDGLHGLVNQDEIRSIVLTANKDIDDKTNDLKDLALLKGGFDNVTLILVQR